MNIHDPQWWKDAKWHRGLAELVERQGPRRLAHPHGTPRQPRTVAGARRKYDHPRMLRDTDLTRQIDQAPAPRPAPAYARPRTAEGYDWRHDRAGGRVDPTFGRLLAGGYYDEYRKAFAEAGDD